MLVKSANIIIISTDPYSMKINTAFLVLLFLLFGQALHAQVFYAGKTPAEAVVRPAAATLENSILEIKVRLAKGQVQQVVFEDKLLKEIITVDKDRLFQLKLHDGTTLLPDDFSITEKSAGAIAADLSAVKLIDRLLGKQLTFERTTKGAL